MNGAFPAHHERCQRDPVSNQHSDTLAKSLWKGNKHERTEPESAGYDRCFIMSDIAFSLEENTVKLNQLGKQNKGSACAHTQTHNVQTHMHARAVDWSNGFGKMTFFIKFTR